MFDVRPIIETTSANDPRGLVPTQIQVQLTWNKGPPRPWDTFGTSGHSPGGLSGAGVHSKAGM